MGTTHQRSLSSIIINRITKGSDQVATPNELQEIHGEVWEGDVQYVRETILQIFVLIVGENVIHAGNQVTLGMSVQIDTILCFPLNRGLWRCLSHLNNCI
jgi:hypothetical protein